MLSFAKSLRGSTTESMASMSLSFFLDFFFLFVFPFLVWHEEKTKIGENDYRIYRGPSQQREEMRENSVTWISMSQSQNEAVMKVRHVSIFKTIQA